MNMEMKNYIYDRYNQLKEEKIIGKPRLEILRTEVLEKFEFIITNEDQVRRIVCDIKKLRQDITTYKTKINEINKTLKRIVSYEIVDGEYVIYVKDSETEAKQIFRFPKNEVKDIFRDFSKHGGNLTQEEMIAKYCNGYPEVWHLIKSRFRIYKESHIIDPDTLENSTAEELDSAIGEATHYHIDVKKQKLKAKFDDTIKKDYYKLVDRLIQGEAHIETIDKILQKYKPSDYELVKFSPCENKPYILGADHHCDGSEQGDKGFITMISDIVELEDKRVAFIINGDDLETLVEGGMHPGQINKMEKTGKNLILHYVGLWEWAIKELAKSGKEVEVMFNVDSNHIRIEENNKKDKEKIGGWLLLSYIQIKLNLLGAEVKLLEEKTNSFRDNGFHFIVDHGHNGFNGKKAKDIVYESGGNINEWNIIVSAHEHHLDQDGKNSAKNILWLKLPQIGTKQGDFAKEHLLSSNPGYTILRKDKRGNPKPETVFI